LTTQHHRSDTASREKSVRVHEIEPFVTQGMITGIYRQLTSGKEATVYCCRADPSTRARFVAVKVYRPHVASGYRRSGSYFEGMERRLKTRTLRAIRAGTRFGQRAIDGLWVAVEYEHLERLHRAGAAVPRPLGLSGHAIAMEYVGNGAGPAPQLREAELDRATAQDVRDEILESVVVLLRNHTVHGDLSPYNILLWKGRPTLIDLPQAVDVRFNGEAAMLLQRDLENLSTFFAKCGSGFDARRLTETLWTRYQRARL